MDESRIAMNKQEKIAWVMATVYVIGAMYLIWNLFFVATSDLNPDSVRKVPYRFFLLFLLGYVLILWKDKGLTIDERDRHIGARRMVAAYTMLACWLLFAATVVGLGSYQEFVKTRSTAWIEGFFILMLLSSLATHAVGGVACYWRDRQ